MEQKNTHLFLEGTVQSGKSTLLRQLLQPHMDVIGGFSCQRLKDTQGRTRAFRIGPPQSTPLTAPYPLPGTHEYIRMEKQGGKGIFRVNREDGSFGKFPQVFHREGVDYLSDTAGKKLLLLDEIGGAELAEKEFRQALYATLAGSVPCIGVIKLEEKAAFMKRTVGYEKDILSYNRELRQRLIEEWNGKIIPFRRGDDRIKEEIEEFICGIFMTN